MGDLYFDRPVSYAVSDPYDSRGGTHKGIDYAAPKDSALKASERGMVVRAAENPKTGTRKRAYGNVIVIDHTPYADEVEKHIYTLYAHLGTMKVSAGDTVKKGEVIGRSGSTGMSTGPHLHFEVIDSGSQLNWLRGRGAMGVSGRAHRKNPGKYFRGRTVVEGALPEKLHNPFMPASPAWSR
ncbi:MAG: M23 family metallopeptidase [Thermodesulfobacteriota bacterium]